jgi:hypothetical protein
MGGDDLARVSGGPPRRTTVPDSAAYGLVTRLVVVNLDWPPMGDKSASPGGCEFGLVADGGQIGLILVNSCCFLCDLGAILLLRASVVWCRKNSSTHCLGVEKNLRSGPVP